MSWNRSSLLREQECASDCAVKTSRDISKCLLVVFRVLLRMSGPPVSMWHPELLFTCYPLAAQGFFGKQEKIERIDESPHRKKWRNGEEVGPGVNKKFTRSRDGRDKDEEGQKGRTSLHQAGLPWGNFRGQGEGSCRTKVWDGNMRLLVPRDNPMKPSKVRKEMKISLYVLELYDLAEQDFRS